MTFQGGKPACSLMRCFTIVSAILFRINRSYKLYVWHRRDIGPVIFMRRSIFPVFQYGDTIAKGFNQMAPGARKIIVALNMSKAFNTININTLIRKLLQTRIPRTIITLITKYIKERKAYTRYRNHISIQCLYKTCVPEGGVLSPTLFNIYTANIPQLSPQVHHIYTHKYECNQDIHTTIPRFFVWTKHNNHTLNPDNTTCKLCTTDHAEYNNNLEFKINITLPIATHPKVLDLALDLN